MINVYEKYIALMTLFAQIFGFFANIFAPIIKLNRKSRTPKRRINPVVRVLNWLMPTASVALVALAIMHINAYNPELELWIDGQKMGVASSRNSVYIAVTAAEDNISAVIEEDFEFAGKIKYKATLAKNPKYLSENEIYKTIYERSQGGLIKAYGLYIDGELVGAAPEESAVDKALGEILEEFGNSSSNETVEFANDIRIIERKYAKKDILSGEELKNIIVFALSNTSVNNTQENYALFANEIEIENDNQETESEEVLLNNDNSEISETVENIEVIEATGLNETTESLKVSEVSEVLESVESNVESTTETDVDIALVAAAASLSNEAVDALPRGGINNFAEANDESIIGRLSRSSASVSGTIQLKKTRSESYNKEMPFEIQYVNSEQYYVGTQTIKQEGANGINKITEEITLIGEEEVSREIIETQVLINPVNKIVLIGTKVKPAAPAKKPTGNFIRPLKVGSTTSLYSSSHRAIDYRAPYGTPIYAADGGTIIYAGFSGSYGNHVKIRHSDGYVTLYAHMSSLGVSMGDKVYQGQEIGKVGSTGYSTGNHLHFEIIVNGTQVNPANYLQ